MRWLPPNKLHLTLVFIGASDAGRVPLLTQAISGVATRHAEFEVATGEAGGRVGGHRGGVSWLRFAHGGHEVAQLALDIDDAIGSRTYDARNAPRPHLTVARGVSERTLADLRESVMGVSITWTIDRISLFRSYTDPAGSRYEELAQARLTPRP